MKKVNINRKVWEAKKDTDYKGMSYRQFLMLIKFAHKQLTTREALDITEGQF